MDQFIGLAFSSDYISPPATVGLVPVTAEVSLCDECGSIDSCGYFSLVKGRKSSTYQKCRMWNCAQILHFKNTFQIVHIELE